MKNQYIVFPVLAMLGLILDSSTVTKAASEAVELVLWTALPALFPFFVLSAILVPYCSGIKIPVLSNILGVPAGWESVFLLGCIGGYPVGAQCVAQGFSAGQLDRRNAERMLGFCTNIGPSFLFGIVAAAFSDRAAPFLIYLICILSALCTAAFWPMTPQIPQSSPQVPPVTLPQAVQRGIKSMASVSAWIILGKIALAFIHKYLSYFIPNLLELTLTGLLELTNGCLSLNLFPEPVRFSAACCFTSFGGLCVWMQVKSLCSAVQLQASYYLKQKAFQCTIALLLAVLHAYAGVIPMILVPAIILILRKKTVEISRPMVYNGGN